MRHLHSDSRVSERLPWSAPALVPPAGPLAPGSPSAAPGCGGEPRDQLHERLGSPRPCELIQPPVRKIVRVVGQPSFIESLRAHVDLSEADRLHREVERGHRRQGEEGRRARHPLRARAGRGLRDEEGDRQARQGADRAGPQAGGGGRGRRQGGRGAARRGQGDPGQVPGRGRPLGLGGQAARARGRAGRGRPPDPPRVDQPVEVEHRRAGRRQGDHHEGGGGAALQKGHASRRPRSTSRSPRPTWPWPRARRSGSRPGWATSRSPPPSTA